MCAAYLVWTCYLHNIIQPFWSPHHCQALNMSKWHLILSSHNHTPLHCTLLLFSFVSISRFLSVFVYSAPFWSLPFLLFSTPLLSSLQLLPLTSFLINRILSHLVSHWFFCCCLSSHNFTQCIPFLTLGLSHCVYSLIKKVFEGFRILYLLIMHASVRDCMHCKLVHIRHNVLWHTFLWYK